MDNLIVLAILVPLIGLAGWVLGIVGFFRASRAIAELDRLKAALAGPVSAAQRPAAQVAAIAIPNDSAATPPPARPLPPGPDPVLPPSPAAPVQPRPAKPRRDWEALLAAKWGVWLGAAALLLAGVFLVRYASDQGLLGPGMRCAAMVILAAALIAAAEWLRRRPAGPANAMAANSPDYAPAALAAGAVAILFGAAYMAGPLYALVPPLVGFALMAAAAFAGLAMSLRLGQLVAAVGIVGAFVTPLLVQTGKAALPGLFGYLLVVSAAALGVVRYAAWVWLGWATVAAGCGWVLAVTLGGPGADAWAPALFVPAAAALHLALLPGAALEHPVGRRLAWLPVAALGAAGLLLALAEPGLATRAGLLLLVPIGIARAATEPRLDRLPALTAAFFLLLILFWGLPAWDPTGEAITAEGAVLAILPGAWAPDVLLPLLETAAAMAALFAAAGLWFERSRPHPLRWAALPAAIPVLALAILYVRVRAFQPDGAWAAAALAVAAGLTGAAGLAVREGGRQRAGIHAAGATAALALGFAMILTGQWLTLAIALFLPALAVIEDAADLPQLRQVALAVAALALVRLLFNPYLLADADGTWPLMNGVLVVYAVAIAAFALTARLFRRRADDLVVAVLELGAAAFATALVLLEVRHWSTGGHPGASQAGFLELALDVSALALLALLTMRLAARTGRVVLGWAWRVQGALALAGGVALIVGNPAFVVDAAIGPGLVANALLPAYAVPAALAILARNGPGPSGSSRRTLAIYALAASFAFVTLEIRHAFHRTRMALWQADIVDAELWAYSGAWLACGLALMALGIATAQKALRLTALAVVALAGAKIFLFDMAGLVGLWRVLSFLGLGLTLIGLGAVYRRFVAAPAST